MIGEGEGMNQIDCTLCFFPFKNQQSSLDNHQSVPREGLGLEEKLRDCPRFLAISP
jgi:hypothetical protein